MADKLRQTTVTQALFDIAIEPAFDFASREYAALFAASEATAFQHPLWLAALYGKLLAANDATPLVIVVRRADRSLAMVLPLLKRRYAALSVVEFADLRVSDFVAPVAARPSFEAILADAALLRRLRSLLKPYDLLRIGKLEATGLPLHRLFGLDEPSRMPTNAYAVPLETDFAAWRERSLDRSYAKELDKKGRQLERKGQVAFDHVRSPADIVQTFAALRIFRRDRFELNGGGELLQIPDYFEFYSAIGLATESGFSRIYRLSIDGRPIAGAVGLVHRGAFLVVMVGFTQNEFKNQSIGSLMLQHVARDCIARGEALLDFTIGDEAYKLIFGATPRPMLQMVRAGSPLGLVAGTMVERLPAVRALARTMFNRGRRSSAPASAVARIEGDAPAGV
jgi:CelD/BcsL family acetyltransferase involved in cellulose biosynthesis